ncbi:MAG TPA: alpha/beta hydrolase [Steroidobacteraceae bacterium]|nr:alpha/beta hydrolase [Steroidobacteraceae bacterium]HQW07747.1 alpha/beta hydrolase [Steroidobacteraceae bacterium]HQX47282.1 alpha/beta hydrolase [Steroidobacteraceae bacterium]HQX78582.1 alpha/beta hydrolase [Steroidobacteraceae bacterium]HQZ80487.1 alpha/beta hydrolase [Steroidobacteraceae bacterium]
MLPTEVRWRSRDGLTLFARDHSPAAMPGPPGAALRVPVVCIPGLTRNSLDFDLVAPWIASLGRRVLAVDLRGRGESDRDPNPRHYQPPTYADDLAALLGELAIPRAIFLGTSLGGLVSMAFAVRHPRLLAGAVLNDVGPEIDPAGAARIRGYVGKAPPIESWEGAVAYAKLINGAALPHYTDADWDAMARRMFRRSAAGPPQLNYDPRILQPAGPLTMRIAQWLAWGAFRKLAHKRPLLLLRGAQSDILAPHTVARMRRAAPALRYTEVPGVGHAPMLSEPAARTALQAFLSEAP